MIKQILLFSFLSIISLPVLAQVPLNVQIQILKAEDARRYDKTVDDLMKSTNAAIRKRAALAAGRIGDENAITTLTALMEKEQSVEVRAMAVFALGEIESLRAADAVLKAINRTGASAAQTETRAVADVLLRSSRYALPTGRVSIFDDVRGRLLEAAGKIAAANASDPKSKELGAAIVQALETELKNAPPSTEVIRLGLTAILRSRPAGSEATVRKFLSFTDPDIVATALNTLARLRAKNANRDARDLLATYTNAIVRANAARVLGAADDKEAVDILIKAATSDVDPRVRVSSIRSLGAIKVAKSAGALLAHGEALLEAYKKNLKPNFIPVEQNEFLEISTALGQILAKTGNERAIALFRDFAKVDQFRTVEPYVARVRVGGIRPGAGLGDNVPPTTYRQYSTLVQTIGELASYEPESDEAKKIKDDAPEQLRKLVTAFLGADPKKEPEATMATPDALQAFARFKTDDLTETLRTALKNNDVQIRATSAGLIAELPPNDENIDAVNDAFDHGWKNDLQSNDAILATMDALFKLDKKGTRGSVAAFILAAASPDQLVRQKAMTILKDDAYKNKPELQAWMSSPEAKNTSIVRRYSGKGTKIGQVLSTDLDYRRALSRRNGSVKAVITTEKGSFTIDFLPEDAPLTVDNFVKLARSGYFNGLEVHRVVPNFVMQDGDPRGDGNGGPGWTIRCEINIVPYERGAVGMALSGKDTGGSQWFVTHSPQPHLDGGYTVFGRVNEKGMKVVDNIVRGDKIISIKIVGK